MRRAWTRFRSLEGWAQASLTSATIALVWLSVFRLPSFVSGSTPIGPAEIAWALLNGAFLYFVSLWLWSVYYFYQVSVQPRWRRRFRRARVGSFVGLFIAFEAIALSVDAVLSGITNLLRHLVRCVRSRGTNSGEPPS